MPKKSVDPIIESVTLEPELEEALASASDAELCDIAGKTRSKKSSFTLKRESTFTTVTVKVVLLMVESEESCRSLSFLLLHLHLLSLISLIFLLFSSTPH